jgi:hypothetical protein
MATSEVDIANAALIKLGADLISDLTENNVRARTMSARYASVRDAELRRRRWKFSITRASLAALSAAPASDYDRQFQLPNDYLRLIEGGDIADAADLTDYRAGAGSALYSIEGGRILTNLGAPLNIRYIAKITNVALFDSAFAEALASRLAYECCERLTQSDAKRELALADYRIALSEARRANAIEAPAQSVADDSWVAARRHC